MTSADNKTDAVTNIEHSFDHKQSPHTGQTQTKLLSTFYQENEEVTMDELEDQLEKAGIVQPPDGDYGWMVVFASFCTNAIVDGIIFTGIFYISF